MSSKIEDLGGLKRLVSVTVPASDIQSSYQKTLANEAKHSNIKGFRKGKVPLKVIEKQSGAAILEHTVSQLVDKAMQDAVKENKLNVAGVLETSELPEDIGKDSSVSIDVTVEVYPDIDLKDFSLVKFAMPVAAISEEDINDAMDKLRDQGKTWVTVDRVAEKGDQIIFDFSGIKQGETEPMENATAEDYTLELGNNQMIPGFEDDLYGMKAGEEKDSVVRFPDDYHAKDLAGKDVTFSFKLKEVQESKLPEWEDLPETLDKKEGGIEAIREEVKMNLDNQLKQSLTGLKKALAFKELSSLNPIEVPKTLVDGEIKQLQKQSLSQMGVNVEDKMPDFELPREPFVKRAESRVRNGLLLGAVIEKFKLKPDDKRVRIYIEDMASAYDSPEAYVNYYMSSPERLQQVRGVVLEDQAVDKLLESAECVDKKMTTQEVVEAQNTIERELDPSSEKLGDEASSKDEESGK